MHVYEDQKELVKVVLAYDQNFEVFQVQDLGEDPELAGGSINPVWPLNPLRMPRICWRMSMGKICLGFPPGPSTL